jgi:hypothetical protein
MDNEGKQKSLKIRGKINNVVQVDAHIGTHIELPLQLGLKCPHKKIAVKHHEGTERRCVQHNIAFEVCEVWSVT